MYKIFLDDLRAPPSDDFIIARSSQEALGVIAQRGIPEFISFDHDLGGDDTAIVFINEMLEKIMDGELSFPSGFHYFIHSANPVGRENIRSTMECALKHLK